MNSTLGGTVAVAGRVLLCAIFLMSAVANKIPSFAAVAQDMEHHGIPWPEFMLTSAILFLVAGSLSVMLGVQARFGAAMLAVFLLLTMFFYHGFWRLEGTEQMEQQIHFMKNLSMLGAMLFIMANGSGPMSLDNVLWRRVPGGSPPAIS